MSKVNGAGPSTYVPPKIQQPNPLLKAPSNKNIVGNVLGPLALHGSPQTASTHLDQPNTTQKQATNLHARSKNLVGPAHGVTTASAKDGLPDLNSSDSFPPNQHRSWANLFKDNRNPSKGIKLHQDTNLQGRVAVEEAQLDSTEAAWGCSLVGYIAGRFPGKFAIYNLSSTWHVNVQHYFHERGWIVFKFENEEARDRVLSGGPYLIFGRPLMLKCMPSCFEFDDHELLNLPIWITLPGLPLECWNATVLSKIASRIGKPITTDEMTELKKRVSYARVLVEVDVSKPLTKTVPMTMPNGRERDQVVIFEYEPRFCPHCRSIKHGEETCHFLGKIRTAPQPNVLAKNKAPTTHQVDSSKTTTAKIVPDEVFFAQEIASAIANAFKKREGVPSKQNQAKTIPQRPPNKHCQVEKPRKDDNVAATAQATPEAMKSRVEDLEEHTHPEADHEGPDDTSTQDGKHDSTNCKKTSFKQAENFSQENSSKENSSKGNSSDLGISVQFNDSMAALVDALSQMIGKPKDNKGAEVNPVEKPKKTPENSMKQPCHSEEVKKKSGQQGLDSSKPVDSEQEEGEVLMDEHFEKVDEQTKPLPIALPARIGNDKGNVGTITRSKKNLRDKRAAALSTQR